MKTIWTFVVAICALCSSLVAQDSFKDKVLEAITNSQEVPDSLKPRLKQLWVILYDNHELHGNGAENELRPTFVSLQGMIEQVLANENDKTVHDVHGVILTPMPATPLCTKGTDADHMTVKLRAETLRDYLAKGGNLRVAYPKEGLLKRTEREQQIYKEELLLYPKNLIDTPLEIAAVPNELVGAYYTFKNEGKPTAFAIQFTQLNTPSPASSYKVWFGSIEIPGIHDRIAEVDAFIKSSVK